MIELRQLAVVAGTFRLGPISLRVALGEHAVLMGKTGSGKSTVLEAVCGLRASQSGTVWLGDREVTRLSPAERNVGYVPQDLALFPTLTVEEHLAFALEVRRVPRLQVRQRVEELAALLGLTSLLRRTPRGLSGGEAQRVALGRALSFHPPVLLLDEPLSALDDDTRQEIYELLRHVQRRTRVTTLHVTHHRGDARALADRLLVLENGGVVEVPASRSPSSDT